jgi:penicillin-binding protein activator
VEHFMTRAFLAAKSLTSLFAAALLLAACATSVTRIAPEQALDLSGRWNDVDSRLVAEEMIRQSFVASSWALRHTQQRGGEQPTVVVGTVRNRSMEHIPVGTFVRDLERAYLNSGQVRVVASGTERTEIRQEREDQQEFASAESRRRMGMEQGANYMLQGEIQSIEDREGGGLLRGSRRVVFYQIDLTLVDLETNSRVWAGQHQIKKYVENPRVRL